MAEVNIASSSKTSSGALWTVIAVSALTLLLYLVPIFNPVSYPFLLLSTLVHEMGHGIAAIMVGGRFDWFKMWADGSGMASISGNFGALSKAFIAAAGLIGPSVVAAGFFLVIKSKSRSRVMLASFAIMLLISILLVVRNLFGVFFVGSIAALCLYFSLGKGQKYGHIALAFFASQLALSVFSRSDYLFTPTAITEGGLMPSDVAQIADALFLPYWFWGICCGLLSIAVLAFGLRRIFK